MADHITASRKLAAGKTRSYILAEKDSDPAVRVLLEKMGRGSCAAVPVHVADRLWGVVRHHRSWRATVRRA